MDSRLIFMIHSLLAMKEMLKKRERERERNAMIKLLGISNAETFSLEN